MKKEEQARLTAKRKLERLEDKENNKKLTENRKKLRVATNKN